MATNNQPIGIATPVPMGDWQASVNYQKLNIVRYNGASYIAKKQTNGSEPTVTQNWQEVWQLVTCDGASAEPSMPTISFASGRTYNGGKKND